MRWGITNNLTLNGTANPDFSQVESDAPAVLLRSPEELFFSEKRPFFLDGIEQFNTPNQLIYTRRIVQPVARRQAQWQGVRHRPGFPDRGRRPAASGHRTDHPVYNLLRVQRDVGSQSRLGLVYTDEIDGATTTEWPGSTRGWCSGRSTARSSSWPGAAPASTAYDHGSALAGPVCPGWADLRPALHFHRHRRRIPGPERVHLPAPASPSSTLDHRVTVYGKQGGLIESFTGDVALDGTWAVRRTSCTGEGIQDEKLHFNTNTSLRAAGRSARPYLTEFFGYPGRHLCRLRAGAAAGRRRGVDTVPFTGQAPNPQSAITCSPSSRPSSPTFQATSFSSGATTRTSTSGPAPTSPGLDSRSTGGPPTSSAQRHLSSAVGGPADRSDTVDLQRSPRLKIEYQLSRPIFLRLVGEYTTERQDDLRDDTRTNAPILIFDPDATATSARAPLGAGPFEVISCSPINRTRARCCLPATAAPFEIRPSWGGPAFGGLRTVSSSS